MVHSSAKVDLRTLPFNSSVRLCLISHHLVCLLRTRGRTGSCGGGLNRRHRDWRQRGSATASTGAAAPAGYRSHASAKISSALRPHHGSLKRSSVQQRRLRSKERKKESKQ